LIQQNFLLVFFLEEKQEARNMKQEISFVD